MTKIYLVTGYTGDYEDAREWVVCAYKNKDHAKVHADHAQKEAERIHEKWKADERDYCRYTSLSRDAGPEYENKYDKCMSIDDTGTEYHVTETELLEPIMEVDSSTPIKYKELSI